MSKDIKTVPNQRTVQKIIKEPCDKEHIYTKNNIAAIDEAAFRLQSKGGFKLYMYIAKNNIEYCPFALSSSHFIAWSGIGIKAYTSAFNELVEQGYLVQKEGSSNTYYFYEKSQLQEQETRDTIYIQKDEQQDGFVF